MFKFSWNAFIEVFSWNDIEFFNTQLENIEKLIKRSARNSVFRELSVVFHGIK